MKLRDFLVENETFSDFLHRNVSMPSSAVEELLNAEVNLQKVKSTFNHYYNGYYIVCLIVVLRIHSAGPLCARCCTKTEEYVILISLLLLMLNLLSNFCKL